MSDANANNDAVKTSAPDATAGVTTAAAPAIDRRRDPAMRALYQMSRTAGVGLQDYAAVNNLAVIGLLCGAVAGLLYLLLWEIPIYPLAAVAGLVLGIVAFVQIAKSNGTQTGKSLAAGAILLSLGVGAWAGVRGAMIAAEDRQHREAITALLKQLGETVKAEKFSDGYALMDEPFQKRVKFPEFESKIGFLRKYGDRPLDGFVVRPEGVQITRDVNGNITATALTYIAFKEADGKIVEPGAVEAILFPYGGQWKIHDIPAWFEAQKPPQRR